MIPRGYTTDNGEPVASTSETPIQRLRRLRFEMEEVEGQLEASKAEQAADPTSSEVPKAKHEIPTGALLAQLRYLRNDLTRLNGMAETLEADGAAGLGRTDELLQRIASPTPSSALPALPSPSPASAPSTSASAADLDDRLLRLERFVGASEADVDEVRASLHSSQSDS
jgi:nuclear migration protein JNM1